MQILKDKISVFQNGARRCFASDGFVAPVFAYAADGEIKVVATAFGGAADKDAFADFMVNTIRENNVTEYLTVTEAWILSADAKTVERAYDMHGTLRDAPGREEAVIILYCTPDSETMSIAKIDRSGGQPALGSWQTSERKVAALGVAEAGGRFGCLFARAAGSN